MGVPDNAQHVVISGTAASNETFAFGYWLDATLGPGGSDLDASTEWVTFRDELLTHMASDQVITAYDGYFYDGGIVVAHSHDDVNHPGTDSSGHLPLQCSTVMTLYTNTLSRRGRGRMYLPTCGASMMAGADHLYLASAVNDLVDKLAAFFSSAVGTDGPAVVVSRMGSAMHLITSVGADRVPDTQRRRRNSQTTARHVTAVA